MMADNVTTNISNISLALYRYLCQNIVGTEDHVKTIRLMNAMRDIFTTNQISFYITSGSFGEGLEMRGSDLDMMMIFKYIEVYEYKKPAFHSSKTYLSMELDEVKPGFTLLKLEHTGAYGGRLDLQCCEKINGKLYYSSALFKQRILLKHIKGQSIHGPCITNETGTFDYAHSLHCKTWISPAVHWITRPRSSWISQNVKQSIISHGVLFVPIGVHESQKEDLEWRVSFSVAEKLLINIFNHTQLLCYALLKVILKDVIAHYPECKDLLCSYFMKTIIFWISDELPLSVWKPDNLIPCFMRCFSRLIYCVEYSVCLHYFIPENNMFENKIDGRAREFLLQKLYMLHSYGWRCILFSDQISIFDLSMWNFPIEPFTLYVKDFEKIINSTMMFCANCTLVSSAKTDMFKLYRIVQILSFQQSSPKHLYAYYMSFVCNFHSQCLPRESAISNNQYKYNQYKSFLSPLLTNIYHDAVSGWLMIASFFYKTKQYSQALHIISYSISKCSPEKLYRNMTMTDIHYQSLKLQSFHKKSLVYMLKIMFVDKIRLKASSTLLPDELLIKGWNGTYLFPSTAYAYFLGFLCHFHLNNRRQYQDFIQGLQLVTEEHYLIPYRTGAANAYNLVGIALQLFGDKESARQAFLQSVKIFPNASLNSAARRLILMG